MNVDELRSYLEWAEGRTTTPYRDSRSLLTVGIGHLLEREYTDEEIEDFFLQDVSSAVDYASSLSYWPNLNSVRRCVVVSLIFNVGVAGFLKFRKFRAALALGDYRKAARELEDSKRHGQIGRRGPVEVLMMETGEWQHRSLPDDSFVRSEN